MNIIKKAKLLGLVIFSMTIICSHASSYTITINGNYGTAPTVPNQPFTVLLTISPTTVISSFGMRVAFDTTQVTFNGFINNTGSPAQYALDTGPVTGGVVATNTNAYFNYIMVTSSDFTGSNIGQLNFTTKPGFTQAIIHLLNKPADGFFDSSFNSIIHVFNDSPVPVELSNFTAE